MVPYIERGTAFTQSVSEARQNNSAGSGTVSSAAMVSVAAARALEIGPVFWPRRSPATGVAREMLVVLRVSNNRQGLVPFDGVAPTSRHLWVGGNSVCPGVSMSRQAAKSDAHMKRIASDADHWRNRLERFAELRRASEPKATGLAFRESSPLVKPTAIVLHHQDQGAET
jgi:hypothetical protein